MTRQLTSAVRHKLLRSPHAKRPPHGRLHSSRLVGSDRDCPRLTGNAEVIYLGENRAIRSYRAFLSGNTMQQGSNGQHMRPDLGPNPACTGMSSNRQSKQVFPVALRPAPNPHRLCHRQRLLLFWRNSSRETFATDGRDSGDFSQYWEVWCARGVLAESSREHSEASTK